MFIDKQYHGFDSVYTDIHSPSHPSIFSLELSEPYTEYVNANTNIETLFWCAEISKLKKPVMLVSCVCKGNFMDLGTDPNPAWWQIISTCFVHFF